MSIINPRNIQNKTGTSFNAGSLTFIYAEDYRVFTDTLKLAGSEIYPWVYNRTTVERDALTPTGSGNIIFNTSVGSLQFWNGTSWADVGASSANNLPQGVLPVGSIPSLSGSYIPQGQLPVGSIPNLTSYITQGVIPLGSLTLVLPQGVLPVGSIPSLTAYIPQGVLPAGSLINSLPQGVLPTGSIPSLTNYIVQGVIPLGSLTLVLPQGVLPVGSIPNLTAYIPQGQLITGSLPNTISISGSVVAPYGSFSDKTVVGSSYITSSSFISYNATNQSLDFTIL